MAMATDAPTRLDAPAAPGRPARRGPLVAILLLGLGLAAAPAAFQMFERAPKGGDMLDAFEPYMTDTEIDAFRGRLDRIDGARAEAAAAGPTVSGRPAIASLEAQWATIDADMGDMLDTMEANLTEYRGVAALPPFVLFPWFFVIPGVLLAGVAAAALRGRMTFRVGRVALVGLGVGLLLAPAVFQMFTRAPGGARMIAEFEPMMTEQRVTAVQGYFLTIGAAEGELRRGVLPGIDAGTMPAVEGFVRDWPKMSGDMAPMIGTMSDNLDNFAAVAALPPFGLFPWFFVIPGLLVVALASIGVRPSDDVLDLTDTDPLEGASA